MLSHGSMTARACGKLTIFPEPIGSPPALTGSTGDATRSVKSSKSPSFRGSHRRYPTGTDPVCLCVKQSRAKWVRSTLARSIAHRTSLAVECELVSHYIPPSTTHERYKLCEGKAIPCYKARHRLHRPWELPQLGFICWPRCSLQRKCAAVAPMNGH